MGNAVSWILEGLLKPMAYTPCSSWGFLARKKTTYSKRQENFMHNLHEPNIITLVWPLLKLEYTQEWEHTLKLTIVALQTTWRSTAESSDPSEGLQLDWSCSLDYCGSVYSVVTVLPCRLQFRSVLVTSHAENIHIHRKHSVNITFIIVLFLLSISFCLCPLLIKGKKKNTNISHYKTQQQ